MLRRHLVLTALLGSLLIAPVASADVIDPTAVACGIRNHPIHSLRPFGNHPRLTGRYTFQIRFIKVPRLILTQSHLHFNTGRTQLLYPTPIDLIKGVHHGNENASWTGLDQ